MRKALFVILVSTFIFISCDNDDVNDVNPFVGEWIAASGYRNVFNKSITTVYDTNNNIYWTASYTYNDTEITVKLNLELSHPEIIQSWGETKSLPYRFDGEILYLNNTRLERIN